VSAAEVREHLLRSPRQLPSRYLYDALGSALFDAICELPWYGITRAEMALLAAHAGEILKPRSGFAKLVELGSGSGTKLRALLRSAGERARDLRIHLVDVSPSALETASRNVSEAGAGRLVLHQRPYESGLREAMAETDHRERTLALFLGSNIGNFEPAEAQAFLRRARRVLAAGDGFLLGADLVKEERTLLLAYDDPLGVTAAFNRNLLHRMNRELGADFRLDRFAHRAVWNGARSRIEMHLVSLERQDVHVRGAGLTFTLELGETIWTESSYKYTASALRDLLEQAGFSITHQWIDDQRQFALTLAEAADWRQE
jgi:dimethylhistidine N-methyltransferase